jgi:hypothetical protein
MNTDEFAEEYTINGQSKHIMVDNDRLSSRIQKDFDGNVVGNILYFIKASEYGLRAPKPGDAQKFDSKPCTITDVKENDGIYEIILDSDIR